MTKSILVASLSVLALAGAAPALAQSSSGSTTNDTMKSNANDPRSMTCAQLSAYDTATVPGVLYFLSGVQAGQRMNGGSGAMNNDASSNESAMKSADAGNANDMKADKSSPLKSADASDSSKSNHSNSSNANANAKSSSGQNPALEIGRLSGYFTIPVQQLITACATDPNKNVAQLLDEQSKNAGNSDHDEMTGSISPQVGEPSKVDQLLPLVYAQNTPDLSNADVQNAKIVGVSSLEGNDASNANLDQTISSRNSDALMAQINGNDALRSKIKDQGYKADDVLAVMKRDDGQLVVYVDDRKS